MRLRRIVMACTATALVALGALAALPAPSASSTQPSVTDIPMRMAHPYKPIAAFGTSDDYHCTLFNPHVTHDQYIVSSKFVSGSNEVHHAALFLVSPSAAPAMERANRDGKGWTCFGLPLPSSVHGGLDVAPLLTFWTPGAGADNFPKGTGVPLPAGSLIVIQVHYSLLLGDKPVTNSLVLRTTPQSTAVLPLHINLMLAPPDLPCPAQVNGPLCNRAASLANLGQRFGPMAVEEVNGIEALCGNNPSDPPQGSSTACTSHIETSGYIVRAYAHMHLLGQSFKMVLNPGTPEAKTVLDVPNFDFHDQKSYNLRDPIPVSAGERVQVTCGYDPALAQELPLLRKAPPHFVTWGDGSTDEMCIGLAWTSPVLPNAHASL